MLRDPKAHGNRSLDLDVPQSRGARPKVLAVSSGGGHWVQMMRIKPAFENCDVTFVTVHESYREQVPDRKFYLVNDANRWTKFGLLKAVCRLSWIVWHERPDVVISTGAAPGYLALRLGRQFNARTIWLDSIANAETLSMSGDRIGRYADLWLTQWPHLARPNGPHYRGSVL
ncbi:UDP-N-acetylglucosamine--LPS N-acetylglucosamine transferase [Bosea thiooxidans]